MFPLKNAFVALPLEGKAKDDFRDVQESLREYDEVLGFQNPDTPHLTLTFWPSMMEIEYHQVLAACATIAEKSQPFTLMVDGADLFAHRGEDRALFLAPQFSPELADVKKRCPWPNPPLQPFHPHVTLARIRHAGKFSVVKKSVMKSLKKVSFPIRFDRLRLYATVDGKAQTPLKDFPFA